MTLPAKAAALQSLLAELGSVCIAYSGGTDSGFLAYAAYQALGDRMLALIADSASLPRAELAAALEFTREHGIPTQILHTDELENPAYVRNDAQRCFHCKTELFQTMEIERQRLGFTHIAYGMNVDDQGEFRPGQKAASLHGALAPLVTAGLTKAEIRALAQEYGLRIWDKPASACLSSRLEYGRPVTTEALRQVEQMEDTLHAMGFRQVRVRHHGEVARIEIALADLPRALSMDVFTQLSAAGHAAGFRYVSLDTEGYRSGSMNDVLPVSAIASSGR